MLRVVDLFGFEKISERKVTSSPEKVIRKLQINEVRLIRNLEILDL
jgi:hypothetical protein